MYKDLSLKEKAKVIREGVKLGLNSIDDILSLYDEAIGHKFLGDIKSQMNISKKEPIKQRLDFKANIGTKILSLPRLLMKGFDDHVAHEDLGRYYFGLPLKDNYLEYSKYKPQKSKNKNSTYIAINDPYFQEELINGYYSNTGWVDKLNGIKSGYEMPSDIELIIRVREGKQKVTPYDLGRFTLTSGIDPNRGQYISYYDIWDASGNINRPNLNKPEWYRLWGTKPFEVYDRIYLDDYYGVNSTPQEGTYYGGWIAPVTVTPNEYKKGGPIVSPYDNYIPDNNGYRNDPNVVTGNKYLILDFEGRGYVPLVGDMNKPIGYFSNAGERGVLYPGELKNVLGSMVYEHPLIGNQFQLGGNTLNYLNIPEYNIALYNTVSPLGDFPNFWEALAYRRLVKDKLKNGNIYERDYKVGDTLGEKTAMAAWAKRLGIPYDTNMLKTRIQLNKALLDKYSKYRYSDVVDAAIKADLYNLDKLRETYKTGKPVGLTEFGWNSRLLVNNGEIIPTENIQSPLNVLGNYNVRYSPEERRLYYSDEYDFNQFENFVPGEPYRIRGYIDLDNNKASGGNLFKKGGIYINPKNKGKLTETMRRTGKSKYELAHSKNSLTRKRALFAINASHWKHDEGGHLFLGDNSYLLTLFDKYGPKSLVIQIDKPVRLNEVLVVADAPKPGSLNYDRYIANTYDAWLRGDVDINTLPTETRNRVRGYSGTIAALKGMNKAGEIFMPYVLGLAGGPIGLLAGAASYGTSLLVDSSINNITQGENESWGDWLSDKLGIENPYGRVAMEFLNPAFWPGYIYGGVNAFNKAVNSKTIGTLRVANLMRRDINRNKKGLNLALEGFNYTEDDYSKFINDWIEGKTTMASDIPQTSKRGVKASINGIKQADNDIPLMNQYHDTNVLEYNLATGNNVEPIPFRTYVTGRQIKIMPDEEFNKFVSIRKTNSPQDDVLRIGGMYGKTDDAVYLRQSGSESTAYHETLHSRKYGETNPEVTQWRMNQMLSEDAVSKMTQKLKDYYLGSGEFPTHMRQLGKDMGISVGQEYPGDDKFVEMLSKKMLDDGIGGAAYFTKIMDIFENPASVSHTDKVILWKGLNGTAFSILGGVGLYGLQNKINKQ